MKCSAASDAEDLRVAGNQVDLDSLLGEEAQGAGPLVEPFVGAGEDHASDVGVADPSITPNRAAGEVMELEVRTTSSPYSGWRARSVATRLVPTRRPR